jgi:Fe-S-cluster-containing dehydrogenase component
MASKPLSRRAFLRSALGAGAAAAVGGAALIAERSAFAAPTCASQPVAQYALVIDTTKCVGCGACVEACNIRNHLPEGKSYIHILPKGEKSNPWFLPVQCQHCANPPCAHVCPTNATYRRDDGVVLINEKLCVGCKYCEVACPYQARTFDEKRGVVDKCWLCLDYVLEGREPACVQSCVLGARLFGRQDDPSSEVAQLIASGEAKPLHPEFGTWPSVLYYVV